LEWTKTGGEINLGELKSPPAVKRQKKTFSRQKNTVSQKTDLGGLGLASGLARGHHGLARLVLLGVNVC